MKEFHIRKNDAGQRLDKFISKAAKNLPISLLYKSIRTKKIKVNRKRAEISQILQEGDVVQIFLPDDLFCTSNNISLDNITPNINIIYEDENILLCDKLPGVSVQPDDSSNDRDALITHIKAYLYKSGSYDPDIENSFVPALCNRIDRNTGGIVIAAKNAEALRIMNEKIKLREIDKRYLCVAHGIFTKKQDKLVGYMIKNSSENKVTVYKNPPRSSDARTMVTVYKVLAEKNNLSLLEVELVTGRTHQIRAHLSSVGHPLLGDGKYGINKKDRAIGYKYQALYSYKLKFSFSTPSGILEYLNGREFSIPKSKISFVNELFPEFTGDNYT